MKPDYNIDYYQVLGVSPDAGDDEIKKAFRKQALLHHPDRNPGKEEEAKTRFQNVQVAHDILNDKVKRAKYDRERAKKGQQLWEQQSQPAPANAASAFQQTKGTNAPRSATASRYAAFAKNPRESVYKTDVNAKYDAFKAWENMTGGHRPNQPQQQSPPKFRPAPTAQKPRRAEWDEEPSSVRGGPAFARSQSTRTPRRGGFNPYGSTGDEPASRSHGPNPYSNTRSERAQTTQSQYYPPPPQPTNGSGQRPDPMNVKGSRPNIADTLGSTYSADRLSTPYAAKSGERTYFTNTGFGQTGPSKSSGNFEDLSRGNRRSPGSGRFRSASPKAKSPRPSADDTSPSESEEEAHTDRMKQSQQTASGRRASEVPRPHGPRATVEDDPDDLPGRFQRPRREQTWATQGSPIDPGRSDRAYPSDRQGNQQVPGQSAPPMPQFNPGYPWRQGYTSSNESVHANPRAPDAIPSSQQRPSLYEFIKSPFAARQEQGLEFGKSTLSCQHRFGKPSWPYWAIPSSVGPIGFRSETKTPAVAGLTGDTAFTRPNVNDQANANVPLFDCRFSIPSSTSSSASPSKHPSAENVNVQFSPTNWHGQFTSASDYMNPPSGSNNRKPPFKGPGNQSTKDSPISPTDRGDGDLKTPQQMPPPPPPLNVPPAQPAAPSPSRFSSKDWDSEFRDGSFVSPGPPLPPRPISTPRARNTRAPLPRKPSANGTKSANSAGEDTGNDGDDEAKLSGSNNETEGEMSRSASTTAMEMDIDSPPAPQPRNTSAPAHNGAHATGSVASPTPGTVFPRPPEPQTGFNMQTLRSVYPLGGPAGAGFAGMKNDLGSTLPFESGASSTAGVAPQPHRLELPQPPKPPSKPSQYNLATCENYVKELAGYMRDFQPFNARMLDHFNSRQAKSDSMMQDGTSAAKSWMGARGDDEYLKYMAGLEEDDHVRAHWDVAWEIHRAALKDLGDVRRALKVLAGAK